MPKHPQFTHRLGRTLRRLRTERALSQEALAQRAGVHRTFVGLVENARRDPGIGTVDKVLRALDVSWVEFGRAIEDGR